MKIVKKKVAQVAIEVLVIMGILVIGSIVLGMTYINNQNKTIKLSQEVTIAQDKALDDLRYIEGFNPDNPAVCGNGMCEPGEDYSNCLIDCHCGDGNCDFTPYGETPSNCPIDCSESLPPTTYGPCVNLLPPTITPDNGTYTIGDTSITITDPTTDTNCTNRITKYSINGGNEIEYNILNPISWATLINYAPEIKIQATTYANHANGTLELLFSTATTKEYILIIPYCYGGLSGGNGTQQDPRIICNIDELNKIKDELGESKFYILGTDLDFQGNDFDPIGNKDKPFISSFDGNGHTISNINIAGEDYIGLFGYTGPESIIKNLSLKAIKVTSNNYAGTLVGYNTGTIENCSAIGTITGNENIGGLVGYSKGTISNSYANVSVTGTTDVGGFIGHSDSAEINNCFSRGNVLGNDNTAGLIGYVKKGKINFIYSTGEVKKNSAGGALKKSGLIMTNDGGEIKNGLWDTETSLQKESDGLPEEWGKTTEDMINKDTYIDWDFDSIWKIDSSINDGYPFLQKNYN